MSCNYIESYQLKYHIYSSQQLSKIAISIRFKLIMNIISMKGFYGYYSGMFYVLKDFNFIPFFIVNTVMLYNYCPTSQSRLLRQL